MAQGISASLIKEAELSQKLLGAFAMFHWPELYPMTTANCKGSWEGKCLVFPASLVDTEDEEEDCECLQEQPNINL